MNPNDPYLKTYRLRLQQLSSILDNDFSKLRDDQLNWKPSKKSWSVAQCLKHLLLASEGYLTRMDTVLVKAQSENLPAKNYSATLSGKLMFFVVDPSIKIWVPAPPSFKPKFKEVFSTEIIQQYGGLLKKVSEQLEASKEFNWNQYKITSPVTPLLRLNLGDVFEILTLHGLRHLKQAQKVISDERFPV